MTRRSDGRYAEYIILDGKRHWFYGKTKAEVLRKLAAYRTQQQDGLPFSDVADAWWAEYSEKIVFNSRKNYRPAYARAKEKFGKMPIKTITPQQIADYVDAFATNHADKTVETQLSVFSMIFRYAVRNNHATYNVVRDLTAPQGTGTQPRHAASSADVARVKASVDLPFGLFAFIAMFTGLRRGELLALDWSDIDLDGRVIHVDKSLYNENNRPQIKLPKTKTSISQVPIPDALLLVLKPRAKPSGLIFPNAKGEYMTEMQYQRAWEKYCAASGVTATAHRFRHTYATMLFEADIPAEEAQHLLRHAQVSTTIDTYTDIRDNKLKQIHKKVYTIDPT